jgi:hypothetical protein
MPDVLSAGICLPGDEINVKCASRDRRTATETRGPDPSSPESSDSANIDHRSVG